MNKNSTNAIPELTGRVLTRTVETAPHIQYLVCPGPDLEEGPVLVAVHGIGRDASALMHVLSDAAQQHGYTLITPMFDERHFCDYQRLGRSGLGERADLALNDILADARQLLGLNGPFHLFGFSGGAQFAHRYVYAWPNEFATVTLAAAGWYTPLRGNRRFPNGLTPTPRLEGLDFSPLSLLGTPTHVMVGEKDTARDPALRVRDWLDERQGRNRVERACWFHRELIRRSRKHKLNVNHELTLLPNCRHDVVEAAIRGDLANHVFDFLQRNAESTPHVACA